MTVTNTSLAFLSILISNPRSILDLSTLKDAAFAKTWLLMISQRPADPTQAPTYGVVDLLSTARGLILELGPGSGEQVKLFTNKDDIKAIYGVEPCLDLHHILKTRAREAGFEGKYHLLGCGGEKVELYAHLAREGFKLDEQGVFDTIVCSKVLCSVRDLEGTTQGLYGLLKPGGRLLVCEHVANPWRDKKGSAIARMFQGIFMWCGWTFL